VVLDEFRLAGRYRSADGTGHVRLATAPRSRVREQFRVEITACGFSVRWRRHPDHPHPGPDTRPRAALPCHPARPSGPYDETGSTAVCTSTCRSHDVAGSSAPTWADLGLGHPDDDGPSVHQAERAARAAMTAFGFFLLPVGGALILFGVAAPWVDGRLTLVGSLVFTAGVLILLVSVVIGFAKDRRRRR
jgi:hypothetical protein